MSAILLKSHAFFKYYEDRISDFENRSNMADRSDELILNGYIYVTIVVLPKL